MSGPQRSGGILRAAGAVAAGTLMSRITGFLRTIVLGGVLGNTMFNDAYNNANVLPNQVYELLLGGLLTSVVVPMLVHAHKDAEDAGGDPNAFAQRLFTIAVVGLSAAAVIGMFAAPLLVTVQGLRPGTGEHDLAGLMAVMLLPQMVFYAIGALAGAVLNIRDSYAAPAWAPVANNLLVIAVGLGFNLPFLRGQGLYGYSAAQIIWLCVGTTAGIALQAFILIPAWRRAGFRWKWRFDWRGAGLGETGALAVWVLGYVVIGQIGFIVAGRVANHAQAGLGKTSDGLYTQWTYASLLFQLPYGILGVSLLTAIMPRMSRAARDQDWPAVKSYLAEGSKLSGLALIPVSVAFWLLSVPMALLFFGHGGFHADAARNIGLILAAGSFGLLPYAITLLQLRVFFAARDPRTPVFIMVAIVAVRVVLSLLCQLLPPSAAVVGLSVAQSVAFVVGAVLGDVILRRRLGHIGSRGVVLHAVKVGGASVVAVAAAVPVFLLLSQAFSGVPAFNLGGITGAPLMYAGRAGLVVVLVACCAVGLAVFLIEAYALRIPEIQRLSGAVRRRLRR